MDLLTGIKSLWLEGNVKKIATNISWLSFDKVFHVIISLSVGIWFARYLEPEKYGTFNYALSVIALFAVFMTLGLNSIIIRDIVKVPGKRYT